MGRSCFVDLSHRLYVESPSDNLRSDQGDLEVLVFSQAFTPESLVLVLGRWSDDDAAAFVVKDHNCRPVQTQIPALDEFLEPPT